MLTRILALLLTATFAALALEVIFGVQLGIREWVHGLLGAGSFSLVQLR